MKLELEPGKYVVAVSGGVDSMVLLDLLAKQANSENLKVKSSESSTLSLELIVAHFDHGIRPDSHKDKELVEAAAQKYGLRFVSAQGHLGESVSEDVARKARYEFLERVKAQFNASAIITAHHQDDLIETALLNLLRGTGRRGLTSLKSTDKIKRPLLSYTKEQLKIYAEKHNIVWREDSTNNDTVYLRNYIRKNVIPKLSVKQRKDFLELLESTRLTNQELDTEIKDLLETQNQLSRQTIINMNHSMSCEVIAAWLRLNGIRDFDRKTIERLVVAIKTLKPGQRVDIVGRQYMLIGSKSLQINKVTQ